MLTWVVYDIRKDRTPTKIAKRCLDFGLYHVQKSVFLGDVPPNRVEEILLFSRQLLNLVTNAGNVFLVSRRQPIFLETDGRLATTHGSVLSLLASAPLRHDN
jgi:CRISPR-associated protein Cas2